MTDIANVTDDQAEAALAERLAELDPSDQVELARRVLSRSLVWLAEHGVAPETLAAATAATCVSVYADDEAAAHALRQLADSIEAAGASAREPKH